jgi:tRNA dimethylallyltransferase
MIHISVVTGHTATGKTARAIMWAQKQGGYIISADSRQLYTDLTIVTGKDVPPGTPFVEKEEWEGKNLGYYPMSGVEVWGYDLVSPDKPFSSFEFVSSARRIIEKWGNDRPLIVVGGTYLYLKHLQHGFNRTEEPDPAKRAQLELLSLDQLKQLAENDYGYHYESLNHSDQNNPRRLIRLIEKGDMVGDWQSGLLEEGFTLKRYEGRYIDDIVQRQEQIEKRVKRRIDQGALEETKRLLEIYPSTAPGLNTLGYKQIIHYLLGHCSWEEAIKDWITAEMQYAKRQLTFMRKDQLITWLSCGI